MWAMRLLSTTAYDITSTKTEVKRLTADRVRRTISRILKRNVLCAIATVRADGHAHVSTAYFGYSAALDLYFLSHPGSLHCRNLRKSPIVAIAVFDSAQKWGELDRGLQLFGTCRETRGATARKAEKAYGKRFKAYARWKAELEPHDTAREYRFYRFVTTQVKVFDEQEFGGAVFVMARVGRDRR
jgi:uncharacterized protein YhbP (UPF0306 family)